MEWILNKDKIKKFAEEKIFEHGVYGAWARAGECAEVFDHEREPHKAMYWRHVQSYIWQTHIQKEIYR